LTGAVSSGVRRAAVACIAAPIASPSGRRWRGVRPRVRSRPCHTQSSQVTASASPRRRIERSRSTHPDAIVVVIGRRATAVASESVFVSGRRSRIDRSRLSGSARAAVAGSAAAVGTPRRSVVGGGYRPGSEAVGADRRSRPGVGVRVAADVGLASRDPTHRRRRRCRRPRRCSRRWHPSRCPCRQRRSHTGGAVLSGSQGSCRRRAASVGVPVGSVVGGVLSARGQSRRTPLRQSCGVGALAADVGITEQDPTHRTPSLSSFASVQSRYRLNPYRCLRRRQPHVARSRLQGIRWHASPASQLPSASPSGPSLVGALSERDRIHRADCTVVAGVGVDITQTSDLAELDPSHPQYRRCRRRRPCSRGGI